VLLQVLEGLGNVRHVAVLEEGHAALGRADERQRVADLVDEQAQVGVVDLKTRDGSIKRYFPKMDVLKPGCSGWTA